MDTFPRFLSLPGEVRRAIAEFSLWTEPEEADGTLPTVSIILSNHEPTKTALNFNLNPLGVSREFRFDCIRLLDKVGILLQVRPTWTDAAVDRHSSQIHDRSARAIGCDFESLLPARYRERVRYLQIVIPELALTTPLAPALSTHHLLTQRLFPNLSAVYLDGSQLLAEFECNIATSEAAYASVLSNWQRYWLNPKNLADDNDCSEPAGQCIKSSPAIYIRAIIDFLFDDPAEEEKLPQMQNEGFAFLLRLTLEHDHRDCFRFSTNWYGTARDIDALAEEDTNWGVFSNAPDFTRDELESVYSIHITYRGVYRVLECNSDDLVWGVLVNFADDIGESGYELPTDFQWDGDGDMLNWDELMGNTTMDFRTLLDDQYHMYTTVYDIENNDSEEEPSDEEDMDDDELEDE